MKKWLKTMLIRVVKTAAETALASIGTTALITGVDWLIVGSTAAMSAVVTILFNLTLIKEPEETDEN